MNLWIKKTTGGETNITHANAWSAELVQSFKLDIDSIPFQLKIKEIKNALEQILTP